MIKSIINGELTSVISVQDRAFNFGDGVFETIAVNNKKLQFWVEHYRRLIHGCELLGITVPSEKKLLNDIKQLEIDNGQYVLKIIVSRGSSGRGYVADSVITPTVVVTLNSWPDNIHDKRAKGVESRLCHHRLVINPALAGIKHLNRIDQVIARNEWHNNDIAEGIMLDHNNNLIEGTASNLFVKIKNQWQTAAVQDCAVAGVIRAFVLARFADSNMSCVERKINRTELSSVQEMFVCNSVWGILPVTQCDNYELPVGNDTLELQKEFVQQLDRRSYVI